MAELMRIEGKAATPRLDAETECRLLRAELQAARASAMRAAEAPPRNNTPWIVGGVLLGLVILMSFAWRSMMLFVDVMREQAEWSHQEKMALADSAPAATGMDPASAGMLGAVLFLAAVLIMLGVLKR